MLTAEVESKLDKQVGMEGLLSFYCLVLASWCETKGYANTAEFLHDHMDEETVHTLKLMR